MEKINAYRDAISTVDDKGKRIWLFPKKPHGFFYNKRKLISYLLLSLLFAAPFLTINGQPLILLDIIDRKFILFGQIFWPQDLHLFAITMLTLVLFVVVFTIVFGRLFCGWICPQTIFMEMIFRRIEYAIEGDSSQQKRLKNAPWSTEKIVKKGLKNGLFWIISFLIANTFLSYFIGVSKLWDIIIDNPLNHIGGFFAIIIFTSIFYLVFSKFREQVCTVVCPYGRLQDVLLDKNSLVVIYDFIRGESRAKIRKGENREENNKGACIDCYQCVKVCPTGIDIRNGTQLECINCTACIDACNYMMHKVGMEPNLIRYDSIEGISSKQGFSWTTRVRAYIGVLLILLFTLTSMLATRSSFESTILRTRGTLYQQVENNIYSNIYDFNIVNKSDKDFQLDLKVSNVDAKIQIIGKPLTLDRRSEAKSKFLILMDKENFTNRKMLVTIEVYGNNELIETVKTTFLTPLM